MKKKCFVIQPFDKARYDKRYKDTFEPAIKEAGLYPYRVDKDYGVEIPIEDIEKNIKDADICLAEITENNANVWYELGYAIARGKSVVLVCSKDREKFPFDVQHRSIIHYETESESDYRKLKSQITNKIQHLIARDENNQKLQIETVTKPRAGLKDYEIATLVTIASEIDDLNAGIALHQLKVQLKKAGFNSLAANLATQKLLNDGLVTTQIASDWNGNETWEIYSPTESGWEWISENTENIDLKSTSYKVSSSIDEEIPF